VFATEGEERRANSLATLKLICDSPVFGPHLEALLATQGKIKSLYLRHGEGFKKSKETCYSAKYAVHIYNMSLMP